MTVSPFAGMPAEQSMLVNVPKLICVRPHRGAGNGDTLVDHKHYIETHGEDMPEIRDWKWGGKRGRRAART